MFRILPFLVRVFFFIPRFEIGRVSDIVYNTRYTIVPQWIARFCGKDGVFLHHFQSDDPTQDFHNHPYDDESYAIILAGGYWEERAFFLHGVGQRARPSLVTFCGSSWFEFTPFDRNRIRPNTFHRVQLRDRMRGCWTLFVAGKKIQPWGFWNRNTGKFLEWSGRPSSDLYVDETPGGAA